MISYSTQALLNYGLISLPANFMHYSIIEKNNWLRQTIDRMKKSAIPVMGISISKEQLNYVDKNFLLYIKKFIKNKYLAINVSQSGLFTNEEFEKVAKIRDSVQKMGSELIFSELSAYYEFEKVCEANSKINSWAEQINNLKIDGKELSPLEKFYIAYGYVTRFVYCDVKQNLGDSRSLISVLTGNKIVCVGYAQMLSELCSKIGIDCNTQSIAVNSNDPNHMNCSVKINDPKYGVHGIFYSDPCFDSNTNGSVSISHALISYDDLPKIFKNRFIKAQKIDGDYKNFNLDNASNNEEAKQLKSQLSKFLFSTKDQLFDYIDKAVENKKGHQLVLIPTKRDLKEIIDLFICYEMNFNEYGQNKSILQSRVNADSRNFNRELFAEKLLKYSRKKDINNLKAKLERVMTDYLPEVTSIEFNVLVETYSRYIQGEKDKENEKMKTETNDLSLEQLKILIQNLTKVGPNLEISTYKDTDRLIQNSLDRVNKLWEVFGSSQNVFSYLSRTCIRNQRRYYSANVLIDETIAYKNKYTKTNESQQIEK